MGRKLNTFLIFVLVGTFFSWTVQSAAVTSQNNSHTDTKPKGELLGTNTAEGAGKQADGQQVEHQDLPQPGTNTAEGAGNQAAEPQAKHEFVSNEVPPGTNTAAGAGKPAGTNTAEGAGKPAGGPPGDHGNEQIPVGRRGEDEKLGLGGPPGDHGNEQIPVGRRGEDEKLGLENTDQDGENSVGKHNVHDTGDGGDGASTSGHFMAYFVTAVVFVVIGYLAYHNKQKLFAFVLEGKREAKRRQTKDYKRVRTTVDETLPGLDKAPTSSNFIY